MKRQLFSMVFLLFFTALLTLFINHVSRGLFSAVSAAKTVKKNLKAKSYKILSESISPSPSPAAELTSDPSANRPLVSQGKENEMASTLTSVERNPKYFASAGAKPHAHMSSNTTGSEGMQCKMCETDAECMESKKTCKKRRCVANDNELILCLRNTHWECGDCHTNSDCHKGLCRVGICAENIHRFHKCQSMISFYTGISNETHQGNIQRDVDQAYKEDVVREVVPKRREKDNLLDVATEEQKESVKDMEEQDTLTVKKNIKKHKNKVGNVVRPGGHINVRYGSGRDPRNFDVPDGHGSHAGNRIEDENGNANLNVQGMAVGIKEKQRLHVDYRCGGSTTRSDTGQTCKQKQVNRKMTKKASKAMKAVKAAKAAKANKKLQHGAKRNGHLFDEHVGETDNVVKVARNNNAATTRQRSQRHKTIKPNTLETPQDETNNMADEEERTEEENEGDIDNDDIGDRHDDDNNNDDDPDDDNSSEDDAQFYASLDWEKLSKSLSPEQWREVIKAYGIPKSASIKMDKHVAQKSKTVG